MLERIYDLPDGVWGLRARGKVGRKDYANVVVPALERAEHEGRRLRFLYQLGPEFDGFTARGALEDARVGMRFMRLFERCAVVTDVGWLRALMRTATPLMPCPTRVFANKAFQEAVAWSSSPLETSITYEKLTPEGVLLIKPRGKLRAEDIDAVASVADAWLESGDDRLEGLVVVADRFPGWQGVDGFVHHMRFVREHQRRIHRIALASESKLARLAPALAERFAKAELRRFHRDDVDRAIAWASGDEIEETPRAA